MRSMGLFPRAFVKSPHALVFDSSSTFSRPISMGGLKRSPKLPPYTPHLSTGYYSPGSRAYTLPPEGKRFGNGCVFSGTSSSLDAFSSYKSQRGYPAMPCQTTGTPETAPHRSSRTQWSFPSRNPHPQQIVTKLARTVFNPTNERL